MVRAEWGKHGLSSIVHGPGGNHLKPGSQRSNFKSLLRHGWKAQWTPGYNAYKALSVFLITALSALRIILHFILTTTR